MGKLTLQDKDLPQVTAYCLLGVWLDAEQGVLGWHSYHATRKTREWQAAMYSFLRSNVKTHSIVVAGARWKQYVRPCMTYACELWAHGGGEDDIIVTENKLLRCVLQAPQDMPVCVLYGMAGELRFTDLCRARRLKFAVKVMGERYEERGPSEAYKEMRRMAELWAKLRSMDASEHKQEQDVAKRRLKLYFNTILEDARVLDRDAAALLREADYPLSAPVDAMQNWEAEWGEWLDDRRSEAEHKAWVKRMGASVKAATLRTATRWLRDTVAESSSLQEVSQLHMYVRAMPCAHLKPSTAQVLRVAARGGLRTVLSHTWTGATTQTDTGARCVETPRQWRQAYKDACGRCSTLYETVACSNRSGGRRGDWRETLRRRKASWLPWYQGRTTRRTGGT